MSSSEEKAEQKPFDSDYYKWSKQINESKKACILDEFARLGVDISPTKLTESPKEEIPPSQGVHKSVWNKAGTWEECDYTKWAKERITEVLKSGKFDKNGYTIEITGVDKCDGQATFVFTKGRKRPGFDFNLKMSWKAVHESSEEFATGYVLVNDFSDSSDGDYEWSFKSTKSDEYHTKAKSAVQSCKQSILKLLNSWIDEFKEI